MKLLSRCSAVLVVFACLRAALCVAQQAAPPLAAPPYPAGLTTIARMVNPAIDLPGQPFSYFSQSTDQIGVMHSPSATEITPEGYLYTGFGELMFYAGIDRVPIQQRIRTLEDGHLPVLSYDFEHDGLTYRVTAFAASLGPVQDGTHVVNFVRITVLNPGSEARRGFVATAWRYQGPQTTPGDNSTPGPFGDNRFRRPVTGKRIGDYQQPGVAFNPQSVYQLSGDAILRDGQAVYFFPQSPAPQITVTYRDYYNRAKPVPALNDAPQHLIYVEPTTPMAVAEYVLPVPAHGQQSLDFKMPLLPVAPTDPQFTAIQSSSFNERHEQVRKFWNTMLARGMSIVTPEDKVNQTYQTSLVNDLLALNQIGDDSVQTINQLHYHGFYLRDSADFVRMYDTTGYPDLAGHVVDFFAQRQQSDGNFLSQPGQFDGWGEALWTYGEHYRITHDKAFAASVYPRILRAITWFEQATAADPLHLMPSTDVHDNEYIPGHLTGYNFLALDGLQAAERIAHDLGHSEDEAHFHQLESALRARLMHQLDIVTATTGGYIPPALDGNNGGADWGNLLSVVPEQQLKPWDPRVTATLRTTQAHYAEGLITYRQPDEGVYLHHYLTIKNTLTELVRGEQEQALREFYAELMHTSSTNAGFEYSIRPWGDRDFSGNLAPHGWFATEYRNLLRNMMLREEGSDLHLLSAVSPAWIGAGKSVHVAGAITYFGGFGFDLTQPSATSAQLILHPNYVAGQAPQHLVLHLPFFLRVKSVIVDGRPTQPSSSGLVQLPPNTHTVALAWSRQPLPPDMATSYTDAVSRYEQEYQRRYLQLTR